MTIFPTRRLQYNALSDENSLTRTSPIGVVLSAESTEVGWTANPPATLSLTDDVFKWGHFFSLRVTNSVAEQPITVSTVESSINGDYASQNLLFHCLILCEKTTTVTVYLHDPNEPFTSVTGNTQYTIAGSWSPVFSNAHTFGDSAAFVAEAKITIVIDGSGVSPLFVTSPILTLAEPQELNQIVEMSRQYFPDVFIDVDALQSNPTNPLMKFYHSLTANMSALLDEYIRIHQLDNDEMGPRQATLVGSPENIISRSILFDPQIVPNEYLSWLAMFAATRLLNDIQLSGVTIFSDPEFDFRRWQISSKSYGQAAGSRNSIKTAARTVLNGTRSVLVTPLWEGEEFVVMVRTLVSETPDVESDGDSSARVLSAIEPSRPAGYVFQHTAVDEIPFILNDPDFGVFDVSYTG